MRPAKATAAGGVVLVLAALTFEIPPLFVPGVAFSLLGLIVPLWVRASTSGVKVTRRLHCATAVEGDPVQASIDVRCRGLGVPGAELLHPLGPLAGGEPVPLSLPPGRRAVQLQVQGRFMRRGRHRLGAPVLRAADPLNLARTLNRTGVADQELLILPRTEPAHWLPAFRAGHRIAGEGRPDGEPLAAVDVDGLRALRPGTPASRIHWPAVARGAGMLERRLTPDAETGPIVVLDPRGAVTLAALDSVVRAAASLVLELARRGGCRLLLPGERHPLRVGADLLAWPRAHAGLAVVQGGAEAIAPSLPAGGASGTLFYVACEWPLRSLAALHRTGASSVLVVPQDVGAPDGRTRVLQVSGCSGYLLGASGQRRRAA